MTNETITTPQPESIAVADKGKRPLLGLNILRAAAIILVLANHTFMSSTDAISQKWLFALTAPNAVIFLMLSGALLLPLSVPTGTFLRRRASRVVTPFIFYSIIYAALTYFMTTGSKFWLAYQVRWLWIEPTFHEGWFIPVILGLYLTYPILTPWIRAASRKQLRYFIVLWFAALTLPYMHLIMGADNFYSTFVGPFYGYIGYAVAGYYLIRYPGLSPRRVAAAIIGITFGIGFPMAVCYAGFNSPFSELTGDNLTLPTAIFAMSLFALVAPIKRPGKCSKPAAAAVRAIDFIAAYSFLIYLIHPLFVHYLVPAFMPALTDSWTYFPAVLAASLILGVAIKKTPAIKHLLS